MLDITKVPLDDKATWKMIQNGKTKGCFQIESNLCKEWCKRIKPSNIKELSDVIALVRPGSLKFYYDGKSMTQHYCDRKNGLEEPVPLHPSLKDILEDTQQVITYQEQILAIAQKIAGFDGNSADSLRRAVGKKDAHLMMECRSTFIKGCLEVGYVNEQEANLIFDNIEKSSRYLFNLSHSISYAYLAYYSAYLKCHYPKEFYLNWLREADDKIDPLKEIAEIVESATEDGISIYPPSLEFKNENFELIENSIYFGFCNIKNIGKSEYEKIREISFPKSYCKLLIILLGLNKRVVDNLIYVGVFKEYAPRTKLLHELQCLRELTDKEIIILSQNINDDFDIVKNLEFLVTSPKRLLSNYKRIEVVKNIINRIKNPGRSLEDNPAVYYRKEKELLGCSLTYSGLDSCADAAFADTTCKDFLNRKGGKFTIAVTIDRCYEHKCKTGETMCFMSGHDSSGKIDTIIIFPEKYKEYSDIIYDEATLLLIGTKGKDNSFIVEKAYSI